MYQFVLENTHLDGCFKDGKHAEGYVDYLF